MRSVLKWIPAGFGLQILLFVLVDTIVGIGNLSDTGYGPWIEIGESLLPFPDAGHAMTFGAISGLLFGMSVYSIVVGAIISLIRRPRYE
jgi:hypothetical protein